MHWSDWLRTTFRAARIVAEVSPFSSLYLQRSRTNRTQRQRHRQAVSDIARHADLLETRTLLSVVTWDGEAENGNWFAAQNWSSDAVPSPNDDVVIDAGVTISIDARSTPVTVKSLQSNAPLSVQGTMNVASSVTLSPTGSARSNALTLNGAQLTISGSLTLSSGSVVRVQAGDSTSTSTLNVAGAATIDGTSLFASGGSSIVLPGANSYIASAESHSTLQANGAGSVLNLGKLTRLSNSTAPSIHLTVEATHGGRVDLQSVQQIVDPTDGSNYDRSIGLIADGAQSHIDLTNLVSMTDSFAFDGGGATASFMRSTRGGTITTTLLTTLNGVQLDSDGSGVRNFDQLTNWSNGQGVFRGGTFSMPKLTQARATEFILNAANLELPLLANLELGGITLGSAATINVPSLSNINGASFDVGGGATLTLPASVTRYTSTSEENVTFRASGTNSLLDLRHLTRITNTTSGSNAINVEATGGGRIDLRSVQQIIDPTEGNQFDRSIVISADGANSKVDLTNLQSMSDGYAFDGPGSSSGVLRTTRGGQIATPGLTTLTGVLIEDDGTGQRNLNNLVSWTNGQALLRGATYAIPNLTQARGTDFILASSSLSMPNLTTIEQGGVTLQSGGAITFPNLSNINGASFLVSGGTTLAMPAGVTNFVSTATSAVVFRASDTGSVLDLRHLLGLTNSESASRNISIEATNGGRIDLRNVRSIVDPVNGNPFDRFISISSQGAGSVIDLSQLTSMTDGFAFDGHGAAASILRATQGGRLALPTLSTLEGILIQNDGTGVQDLSVLTTWNNGQGLFRNQTVLIPKLEQALGTDFILTNAKLDLPLLESLELSTLTLNNASSVSFPSLLDFNGSSVFVSGGSTFTLPETVIEFGATSPENVTLRATDANSVLDLRHLKRLVNTTERANYFFIDAINGGQVNLSGVTEIVDPVTGDPFDRAIFLKADGPNSRIDLSDLTSLSDAFAFDGNGATASVLTVRRGGVIQTPDLESLIGVQIENDGTSPMQFDRLREFRNGAITIMGSTLNLPALEDLTGTELDLSVSSGNNVLQRVRVTKPNQSQLRTAGSPFADTVVAQANATTDVFSLALQASAVGSVGSELRLPLSTLTAFEANLAEGNDRFDGTLLTMPLVLNGGLGNDSLTGGMEADRIDGSDGDDFASGLGGNDVLVGGLGQDALRGGGGSDLLVGGEGNDSLFGQGSPDTIDGGAGVDFIDGGTSGLALIDQLEGTVELTNTGYQTPNGDRVIAESLPYVTLYGGPTADLFNINAFTTGLITVFAGSGNDTIVGGMNDEVVYGGDGDDLMRGAGGQDQLFGENGNDVLRGQGGSDILSGGQGDDVIDFGVGSNYLREDADVDFKLETSPTGVHRLTGLGTDVLAGILAGARLTGDGSSNQIDTATFNGPVTLSGGGGDDVLIGSAFGDMLYGGDGRDLLQGGTGNDVLVGETGNDSLQGQAGNDVLSGETGQDQIDGGLGFDRLTERANSNFIVTGLVVQSPLLGTKTGTNIEVITITGGSSANMLDARQASIGVVLNGANGDDTLLGSAFGDTLLGDSGNDVLSGAAGTDDINGGSGRDIVTESGDNDFTIIGRRLISNSSGDEIATGIEGFALIGGDGRNTLNATESAVPVTLLGARGNDTLLGSAFDDVLIGGARQLQSTVPGADGTDLLNAREGNNGYDNDPLDVRTVTGSDEVLAAVFSRLPSWLDTAW